MCALHDQPWPGWSVRQLDVEYVETPAQFLTELAASLLQLDPVLGVLKKTKDLPTSLVRWVSGALSEVEVGALGELKLKLRDSLRDEQWPELAEQLLGQLQRLEGSLLIIIDEFPMMVDTFLNKDEGGCLRFLRWFRAQRRPQKGLMLRFLLGGSVNIEPRLERLAQEAVLNDMERFHLQPLPLDRAVEFVTEVFQGENVPFEEGTPLRLVETAGTGVHFFLQVLINECMSEMRQQRWPRLRVEHIQPIYESRVLGPPNRARFSHYHSRLRSNYGALEEPARLVLAELTLVSACDLEDLRKALLKHDLDKVDLDDLVARLESDYYVTRSGGHIRFHSNFLKDWWLRNAPGVRRKK
jgi:hypothetical protein